MPKLALVLVIAARSSRTGRRAGDARPAAASSAAPCCPPTPSPSARRPAPQLGSAPINGVTPPFPSQPVQGFSAVLDDRRRRVLGDARQRLRREGELGGLPAAHVPSSGRPSRRSAAAAARSPSAGIISLRDPDSKIPFPIVRGDLPAPRLLTGGDFDIESVRRDRRGELWFGDEFGPWLLHTSATGRLLEAPIALPGVKSPDNPTLAAGEAPNLAAQPRLRGHGALARRRRAATSASRAR